MIDTQAPQDSHVDRFYGRAARWAHEHGAPIELVIHFAAAYQEYVEDLAPNQYPDLPELTPAEFADENALEYGQLVDTAPIGTVIPVGVGWVARCTSCGWNPTAEDATSYANADNAASVHNSKHHGPAPRPQWNEIAEWAAAEHASIHA